MKTISKKKMDTKQILKRAFLLVLSATAIVSCNNDEVMLDIDSDVVVINKKIDGVVKHAPAYYVYANRALESATVTPPGGVALELDVFDGSVYSMSKEPETSDFSDVTPAEGNYTFSVTSVSGETLQSIDALDYTGIAIPPITKSAFSGTPLVLNVEWTTVSGADGYFLKLLDSTGNQVFSSYIVVASVDKYTINGSVNSGSWSATAEEGQTYTLQLNAITFDNDGNMSDNVNNISELSVDEKQIVWGEN